MDTGIIIKLPLKGCVSVIAEGKGHKKVEAVARFESVKSRFKSAFKAWHQTQDKYRGITEGDKLDNHKGASPNED